MFELEVLEGCVFLKGCVTLKILGLGMILLIFPFMCADISRGEEMTMIFLSFVIYLINFFPVEGIVREICLVCI